MSKRTKAAKHEARVRSHKKRKPRRINPIMGIPTGGIWNSGIVDIAFDQALLEVLRMSGIRDALFNAIKNAPPKDSESEDKETIQ